MHAGQERSEQIELASRQNALRNSHSPAYSSSVLSGDEKKHNLPRTCRHVWGWMNLLNGVPLHSHSRRANMSVWPVMVVSPSPFGLTFVNPTDPVQMEEVGKHRMNGFNHNNDIGKGITTTPLSMGTGQITVLFDILGTG